MTAPEFEQNNLSIFWDVENVADEPATHKAMTDAIRSTGTIIKSYAFADWDSRRLMAEELHALGYDLIHVPDSSDNAADYKMASYILDHLTHYPETRCYVLITGDGDFRLIAGALKQHGVELWLISNPVITASDLPNLANKYSDIYSFRPSLDCVTPEDCDASVQSIVKYRHVAAVQLEEVVRRITKDGGRAGVGHAKASVTNLNPDFNEKDLGFKTWSDFLEWSEAQGYIKIEGSFPSAYLLLPSKLPPRSIEISQEVATAFEFLSRVAEDDLNDGPPPTLKDLGQQLRERGLEFEAIGYRRFSDFVLSAEKRGLIRILESQEDENLPIVLPVYGVERMQSWFEENVERLFGSQVNVPKTAFLKKISQLLLETRTTLTQLESFLLDESVRESYRSMLEASNIPFLPPFQMSIAHILFGKGKSCSEVISEVNRELRPLGIVLKCKE
jgi:hypothetical protein